MPLKIENRLIEVRPKSLRGSGRGQSIQVLKKVFVQRPQYGKIGGKAQGILKVLLVVLAVVIVLSWFDGFIGG
ncbi:hypothetical protein V8V91_08605 [Algoriphagus halophilus]|uniref:hypothetical protein n=1 Tax=Algoriphagus halophilus TaxID=226505 RepID=UPI00358EDF62